MTVPVIDGIDHSTWEYRPVYEKDHSFRGIFEWGMLYKEIEIPAQEESKRTYKSEPYKYYLFVYYFYILYTVNCLINLKCVIQII